jgi:hypothetical protein
MLGGVEQAENAERFMERDAARRDRKKANA